MRWALAPLMNPDRARRPTRRLPADSPPDFAPAPGWLWHSLSMSRWLVRVLLCAGAYDDTTSQTQDSMAILFV